MLIGGLQKLTLIDYPGKIAATVFLTGCNFSCPWCYNPELVLPEKIKQLHPHTKRGKVLSKPEPAEGGVPRYGVGVRISEKEIFDFLKSKQGLLEGVVICGGEPCINKDLPKFIKKIKKLGYAVKVDTNGSNPKMLKELIEKKLIDYIAMDVKAPLENQKYNNVTGVRVNLDKIKKSIDIIRNSGVDYEFRTTVNPLLEKEDIFKIARWILGAKKYYLQNFRPEKTINPKFAELKSYPEKNLLEIQKAISPFFETCQLR